MYVANTLVLQKVNTQHQDVHMVKDDGRMRVRVREEGRREGTEGGQDLFSSASVCRAH